MYTNDFYVFDRQEFKALNILVHTLYIYVLNFVPKQIVGMSQKFKLMVPSSLTFLCWSLTINCYKLTDFTSAPMSPCTLLLTLVMLELNVYNTEPVLHTIIHTTDGPPISAWLQWSRQQHPQHQWGSVTQVEPGEKIAKWLYTIVQLRILVKRMLTL